MRTSGDTGDPRSRRLVLLGASFRSAEPALRERLFLEPEATARLVDALLADGCAEVFVLPTCDRLEIYAGLEAADGTAAVPDAAMLRSMARTLDWPPAELGAQTYRAAGDDAIDRLFGVVASLDSAVPGETQLLGQVKEAYRLASEAGAIGPLLAPLLQAALACAKRVRSDTDLGRHPVSMVAAARSVAQRLYGDLARSTALLVGLGDMGLLIADALKAAGLGPLTVMHPTDRRAAALARDISARCRPWDELADALADSDIAIAAIGVGRIAITRPMVEAALAARRHRPILLLDASIPGDIDPRAGEPADAFLYGMDDLDRLALDGMTSRQEAAAAARSIVTASVEAYRRDRTARDGAPALVRLRDRLEAARADILARHGDDADEATRRLLNRMLHDPAQALRRLADAGEAAKAERWLARLFGDGTKDGEDGA